MIILDTSGLLAALLAGEPRHSEAAATLRAADAPLLLSPFVLAELDYLLLTEGGVDAELALLNEVATGAYELVSFEDDDVAEATEIIEQFSEQEIGLADASLVVLSRHHRTDQILTLDERHFRLLPAFEERPFRILPNDL